MKYPVRILSSKFYPLYSALQKHSQAHHPTDPTLVTHHALRPVMQVLSQVKKNFNESFIFISIQW